MADHNHPGYDDGALGAEFAAFRTELFSQVTPPGPDAVRHTVRRRRRVAVTTGLALVLVLVIGPVAGYAALDRSSPPPTGPAATGGPSPSPTVAPEPTASPTPAVTGTPVVPDGRISRAQLLGARLDLPAWRVNPPCKSSRVKLLEESAKDGDNLLVGLAYGDVDRDGATETVAVVHCVLGLQGPRQVVAFDRDEAGKIVTMGQVTRTEREAPEWIFDDLEVRPNGVVRVQLGDIAPGGGWNLDWSLRQWRGYSWDGESFVQSEGERDFPDNPHRMSLAVTATDLVYGAPDTAGQRTGAVTITMNNHGALTAERPRLVFTLSPGGGAATASPGWYACEKVTTEGDKLYCTLPPMAPKTERKLTFHILTNGAELPTKGTVAFQTLDDKGRVAVDFGDWDNEATLTIK